VLNREAPNTNSTVFSLTRPGLESTIYRTQGEHANIYTTDVVYGQRKRTRGQTMI